MSAVDWARVRKALQGWVVAGSALPPGQVYWVQGGGVRPPVPLITIEVKEITPIGQDWVVTVPAPEPTTPGRELVRKARGIRRASLELQCFTVEGTSTSAMIVLTDVMASLPLYLDDLDFAGVGVGEMESVRGVSGKRNGILEPRAVWGLNIFLGSEVQGFIGFIQSIDLTVSESTTGSSQDMTLQRPEIST